MRTINENTIRKIVAEALNNVLGTDYEYHTEWEDNAKDILNKYGNIS